MQAMDIFWETLHYLILTCGILCNLDTYLLHAHVIILDTYTHAKKV